VFLTTGRELTMNADDPKSQRYTDERWRGWPWPWRPAAADVADGQCRERWL
jgi:hypothetical protein